MALEIGDENATSGMTKAIYDKMDELLNQSFENDPASLEEAQKGWKNLSFAIATGVINHILDNMEIKGVTVIGDVASTVAGDTKPADPDDHKHGVNLSGTATNVVFTQNNDGDGLVA